MTLCDTCTKNNSHISHFCTTTVLHCGVLHSVHTPRPAPSAGYGSDLYVYFKIFRLIFISFILKFCILLLLFSDILYKFIYEYILVYKYILVYTICSILIYL